MPNYYEHISLTHEEHNFYELWLKRLLIVLFLILLNPLFYMEY